MSWYRRFAICMLASALCACAAVEKDGQAQDQGSPGPDQARTSPGIARPGPARHTLELEFRSISRFPTCLGNERIRVDAQGRVFKAKNTAECERGNAWSMPYPAEPARTLSPREIDQLAELVTASGIFDLPAHNTDPKRATTDGHREEIELTLDGRRHTVTVDNTEVPAFSRVRQELVELAR